MALLVLAGLAEGIGFISLLPLLGMIGRDPEQPLSGLAEQLEESLSSIGVMVTPGLLLALIVAGIAIKTALFLAAVRQAGYLGADVSTSFRTSLVDALSSARWPYFVAQPAGLLTNALGIEAMRGALLANQLSYLGARVIQVVIYLTLALVVSWQVTLGAVVFGGAMFALLQSLVNKAGEAARAETTLLQSLIARLADGLAAMKSIRAMGREQQLRKILIKESEELGVAQKNQVLARAVLPAVQEPAVTIALALGLYIALRTYDLPAAELLYLAFLFHRIVTRMGAAQTLYQGAVTYEPAFRSVQGLIEDAESQTESRTGKATPSFEDELSFDSVYFSYDSRVVLHDVSFWVPRGAFISITGPSGVGKTTLIDLIVGLLTPSAGVIYLDGRPLADLDMKEWRRMVGYVPQDPVLLHESVLANVSLQDPSIGEERLRTALSLAGALHFVDELPEGMDTIVGERGVKLSGGQRQRVAIARAIVHDPALLLLDEATTALDPKTEREILRSLSHLKERTTILSISHQEAVRRIADQHLTLKATGTLEVAQEQAM